MRKILLSLLMITTLYATRAQNLYYRLDIGTNNIYTFAAANLATAGLNALADKMLFDNAYTYTYINTSGNIDTKGYNVAGMTARELFSDITAGGKIGYQSFNPGSFNWGIYGSAHYRINQFKSSISGQSEEYHTDIQRLLLGGGLLFNLGDIESRTRFVIEAGVRYEMPIRCNQLNGQKVSDILDSGLSSHFALRINGNGLLQGLGVYADIPHYDMLKKTGSQPGSPNLKMFTFGLIYTITPWKIREMY